jgi:hypothetical protein
VASKSPTRLAPAPLPNGGKGGFLSKRGNVRKDVHQAQLTELEAKHDREKKELLFKQQEEIKGDAQKTVKAAKK